MHGASHSWTHWCSAPGHTWSFPVYHTSWPCLVHHTLSHLFTPPNPFFNPVTITQPDPTPTCICSVWRASSKSVYTGHTCPHTRARMQTLEEGVQQLQRDSFVRSSIQVAQLQPPSPATGARSRRRSCLSPLEKTCRCW